MGESESDERLRMRVVEVESLVRRASSWSWFQAPSSLLTTPQLLLGRSELPSVCTASVGAARVGRRAGRGSDCGRAKEQEPVVVNASQGPCERRQTRFRSLRRRTSSSSEIRSSSTRDSPRFASRSRLNHHASPPLLRPPNPSPRPLPPFPPLRQHPHSLPPPKPQFPSPPSF